MKAAYWLSVLACLSLGVHAGEIELTNGEILKGELSKLEGDTVVWKSPVLGNVKIKKSKIRQLSSSAKLKARSKTVPCYWDSIIASDVVLKCEDGDRLKVPYLTLEKLIPFKDHRKATFEYGGRLSILGSESRGNIQAQNWTVRTDNHLRHDDFRHKLGLQYHGRQVEIENNRGERENGPVEEQYQGTYTLDWFFSTQIYYFNQLRADKDDKKNIQERYNFSTGLGYQWWESKKTAFSTKLGGLYTHEYYQDVVRARDDQSEFASWQFANDYRYKFANGISFFHKHELSRSLEENDEGEQEWIFDSFTGAQIPLGFGVSADLGFEYDYDSHPTTDEKEDTTFRVGLGYKW